MTDIASLGIKVTTTGVQQSKTELDGLVKSSDTAAAAVRKVSDSWHKAAFSPNKLFSANQALNDYKRRLQETAAAATAAGTKATTAFNGTALSAKQMSAALRQVPMQFTDIATSLASGQRPLQVLLQQGGQLKDIFGGVGPAIRALGGYVLGLINPFTLAAAAVVGLGLAWKSAADEAQSFNLAIIQTGQFSGNTARDLEALASRLDETTEATQRFASGIVAQVEGTGRFTKEQVDTVSTAITNMAKATQLAGGDADEAIKGLIKSFSDLSKDPVEALLKLNETQHFLTRSTLDQVESLVEQGKQTEAADVAIKAMADTLNTRAPEMVRNVNSASAVWGGIKSAIAETYDELVKFFREADVGVQGFIRRNEGAFRLLAKFQSMPLLPFSGAQAKITDSLIDNALQTPEPTFIGFKPGAKPTVDSEEERRRIKAIEDAQRSWNASLRQGETDAQRLKRALDEVAESGKLLKRTPQEIKAAQDAIRASFAKKGPKGRSDGIESATSRSALQALQDQLRKEQGLLANQAQIIQAHYAARNISAEKYYAEQKRLLQEGTAAQERALTAEIAALSSRALKGKDSINNAREIAEREAELARVRADGAAKLEVLNIQEAAQIKQRQQANIAYKDALDQGKEALQAELDSQVLRITVGEREFEIRSRIIQLYRDEAKELLNLARQRDAGDIDPDTYTQRVEQLRKAIAEEVQIVRDGYDAMAEAQKNWANGALKAFADYQDAANDVAGQTYGIFNDTLRGLEDAFVDFFTKGKADWKGFFDSIAADITRFVVRQQLSKLFTKFMPGGDGNNAAQLSSAAGQLAASAVPLTGAATALSGAAAALAAAGAGSAVAGSSTGGDTGVGSWVGAIAAIFGGGRASGGPVSANRLYEVGEGNRPELLQMHGRSFLIPGNQGNVTPIRNESAPKPVVLNQTFVVQGAPDRRTREQMARSSGREARRGMNRTGG